MYAICQGFDLYNDTYTTSSKSIKSEDIKSSARLNHDIGEKLNLLEESKGEI